MSVSDGADTTATSGSQIAGVPQDLLTATDFISVRAGLVKLLGNDANRAIVLTRILWRADARWREAVEADGHWWWRATREAISEETGLSVDQVKRVLAWLVREGYVVSVAHQIDGRWDQTRSLRVNVIPHRAESHHHRAESPDIGAESHRSIGAESHYVPSLQTEKTNTPPVVPHETSKPKSKPLTEMVEGWLPSAADVEWAKGKGYEVDYLRSETERFVNHFLATGGKKREWGRAWRNWVSGTFVRRPGSSAAAKPSRTEKFNDTIARGKAMQARLDAERANQLEIEGLQ